MFDEEWPSIIDDILHGQKLNIGAADFEKKKLYKVVIDMTVKTGA
jgi:hypothetical protein